MDDVSTLPAAPTRAQHEAAMTAYGRDGERRALALGNRGPMRFAADGRLHPDILAAYWRHGFYVFEGVIGAEELAELRADALNMIERAPVTPDAKVDAQGRPALGRDYARDPYSFCKPLGDPWGGTGIYSNRHPARMAEPTPEAGAPEQVIHLMRGMCQAMPSALRLYGHPKLLAIAATVNGDDFVPFNDVIFVKQPGVGGSVAWHQDGITHWNAANWDEGIHGFNFQTQLYPSTLGNCLWAVPGTHKRGRIDIRRLVEENGGSDRLPGAVPMFCQAGDVTMANRQILHGSFANTSPDLRISITFGFHRRASVLGQKAVLSVESDQIHDQARIFERSAVIAVAIDARRQRFAEETPFRYRPFAGLEEEFRCNEVTFARVIRDYNTKDLTI